MTAPAHRRFLHGYERRLAKPFRASAGEETTLRKPVRARVPRLADTFRGGGGYAPFVLP